MWPMENTSVNCARSVGHHLPPPGSRERRSRQGLGAHKGPKGSQVRKPEIQLPQAAKSSKIQSPERM